MAAALFAAAERGAAAVAAGPADDIEAAEAKAIRQTAAQPAPEPGVASRLRGHANWRECDGATRLGNLSSNGADRERSR